MEDILNSTWEIDMSAINKLRDLHLPTELLLSSLPQTMSLCNQLMQFWELDGKVASWNSFE